MKLKEAIELPIVLSKEQGRDILELLSQLAEIRWDEGHEASKFDDQELQDAKNKEVKSIVDIMTALAKKIGGNSHAR